MAWAVGLEGLYYKYSERRCQTARYVAGDRLSSIEDEMKVLLLENHLHFHFSCI